MAASIFPSPAQRLRNFLRGMTPVAVAFAVVVAVSFLPPDRSLREVEAVGRIRVCMPAEYPPLVMSDPDMPGFEVELMQEIAARAGWRFNLVYSPAMGRDFNPRSWHITRAQCEVLAGGVALTRTTRSFIDTTPGHLLTGWAMASERDQLEPESGQSVGFYAGMSGLDRVQLGQYLRAQGSRAAIQPTATALRDGLVNGEYDAAVTEALIAFSVFDTDEWHLNWLPQELGRFSLGFGFWRGDTTLRRHVEGIMDDLVGEGFLDVLADRYSLDPELFCHQAGTHC